MAEVDAEAPSVITFAGEEFLVADRIGLMPLMRFAHLARAGVDAADEEGLVALYDLLEQCFSEDVEPVEEGRAPKATEWERFQAAATRARVSGDELLEVVKDAIQVISARPTGRSSSSSPGPSNPSPPAPSESDSESRVVQLLPPGRGDLASCAAVAMRSA